MKRLLWLSLVLAFVLAGCSRHYREALDRYRLNERTPYAVQVHEWALESERSAPEENKTEIEAFKIEGTAEDEQTSNGVSMEHSILERVLPEIADSSGEKLSRVRDIDALQNVIAPQLGLEDLLAAVAIHNPAVQSAHERWRATLQQYDQATYLENLIASFRSLTRYLDVSTGRPAQRDRTKSFTPGPSVIALKGELVDEQVRLAELQWEIALREAAIRAGEVFFELQYLGRVEATTLENIALLEGLADVIEERFRTGVASQPDLLKVQNEIQRQQNMIGDVHSMRRAHLSMLAALLGLPEGSSSAGTPESIHLKAQTTTAAELYQQALDSRQELEIARAQVMRTSLAIRLGEIMNRPEVSQGYSRFERGAMPEASESVSRSPFEEQRKAMLMPSYAQAEAYLAEMRQRKTGQERELENEIARTDALSSEAVERIDEARRQVELLDQVILPRDQSIYETILSNYVSGRSSFLDLLDAERQLIRTRLELHEAARDLNLSIFRTGRIRGFLILQSDD